MAYMKKVTDAVNDVGYGDGWFKIQHAGLNVESKMVHQIIENKELTVETTAQGWAVTDLVSSNSIRIMLY